MAPKKPSWATDPLEGALGAGPAAALRGAGRYIGGGLQDFLGSQAVRESPFGAASTLFAPRKAYAIGDERQGPYVPERLQRAPSAPVLPGYQGRAPITSPNTTFQNADDEYNRLISQYGPSGIEQLSGMTSLPTGFTPTGSNKPASLKDYYTAQTLQGSAGMGNIISAMGYKGDMAKWAQANPMLAQREFSKRFGGATLGSAVQSDGSVRGMPQAIPGLDTSKMMPTAEMQGTTFPGQGQGPTFNPAAFSDQSDFGTPANAVPAPPEQQGMAVSAPYAAAQRQAAEKTAGATGMPNFETTPEAQTPGKDFLGRALSSPWGQALKNTTGAMGIDYIQGIR